MDNFGQITVDCHVSFLIRSFAESGNGIQIPADISTLYHQNWTHTSEGLLRLHLLHYVTLSKPKHSICLYMCVCSL